MTAVVQTEGLTTFYGKRRGPEDLDLLIHPGEVFGYLGPNGSGKTDAELRRFLLSLKGRCYQGAAGDGLWRSVIPEV